MQRIVRSALAMSGAGSESGTATTRPPTSKASNASSSSGFKIFDERRGGAFAPYSDKRSATSRAPPRPETSDDVLLRRTKALSLADPSPKSPSAMSAMSMASSVGTAMEAELLPRMIERLEAVLEITQSRKGCYPSRSMPRPVSSSCGPKKWVTRYVDYTSKYGLGFLLNDGSSGVYFNDSTKTALEPEGERFQYFERRKVEDHDGFGRRSENTVDSHTLSSHPEALQKKVTLLKHFRNYLLEQQGEDGAKTAASPSASDGESSVPMNLVYVKKWVRTKHAILFRLSNQTVQVVFYDQSEILLTPDERYITYVDKNRNRSTYSFTDDLVGSSAELEKRCKYAKDIMSSLISGGR